MVLWLGAYFKTEFLSFKEKIYSDVWGLFQNNWEEKKTDETQAVKDGIMRSYENSGFF